jgi:AraC family transcriptional regulator, regulatory protein of adaptative response / DNA-3-methyladenine glycosylase II
MDLDRTACYRAVQARDPRFDGRFYTAVVTTGVYCRPICPARTPKFEHCIFFPSAAAAHAAGFRPCLRCRPEIAPGLAGWRGTANTALRALGLIAEGALDEDGVEGLAARLGVGGRHLRRLFDKHLGASPLAVAQTQRLLFAKRLISETPMPMAEVALAAGFGSVRRFNAVIKSTYGRAPRDLRRLSCRRDDVGSGITLRLPFSPPYDWPAMVAFLAPRAIPGVESVDRGCYRRTVALDGARGTAEVRPAPGQNQLLATIRVSRVTALGAVVGRLRRLFDLDADIEAIGRHLSRDPLLAPAVAARPGLRVPGAWDSFELAVRAILGQQVSVAAATTLAGRLAAAYGESLGADGAGAATKELGLVFPRPEALAGADLTSIGLPRTRAAAISALAAAVVTDGGLFRSFGSLEAMTAKLERLPGIGPWTAQYIAMRALREPDAFPAQDLGVLRAMTIGSERPTRLRVLQAAEAWRPWRAYAAMHLWLKGAAQLEQGSMAHESVDRPRAVADRDHPRRVRRGEPHRARLRGPHAPHADPAQGALRPVPGE